MNDFLVKEITKAYEDIYKGHSNTYNNDNLARQNLNKAMGRMETLIELLKNKTITVNYREGE